MLVIDYKDDFLRTISNIKDQNFKERVKKQVERILECPEVGKPMKYARKGTREVHIKPYRLSYAYLKSEDKIVFLNIYHKDEQ